MSIKLTILAAFVLAAAPAFAEDALFDPAPKDGDAAARLQKNCEHMKLNAAAMTGKFEALLHLDARQKPLFDEWRNVLMASIGKFDPACTEPDWYGGGPLLDRVAHERRSAAKRAAALDAETPSLTALYGVLDAKQQQVFSLGLIRMRFAPRRCATPQLVPAPPPSDPDGL